MKRVLLLFCALCVLLSLSGCAQQTAEDRITVVAAIFPEYDWVRQIIGDSPNVSLKLLVDNGVDPHSFQPKVSDIVEILSCDLLIYGGGESDEWLSELDGEEINPNRHVLELLPLLGENAHVAELTEGMRSRETEEELDEHVWLSLKNAKQFCIAIADMLKDLDSANAALYERNLTVYLEKLDALDEQFEAIVNGSEKSTIVVCDRFPFRYLVEDYGLNYYAAFPGCSSESGASFETIVFLAEKVNHLEANAVLTLEGSDGRIARTVAENSGREAVEVLTLNSMQSISLTDGLSTDYLTIMEENSRVLEKALG